MLVLVRVFLGGLACLVAHSMPLTASTCVGAIAPLTEELVDSEIATMRISHVTFGNTSFPDDLLPTFLVTYLCANTPKTWKYLTF